MNYKIIDQSDNDPFFNWLVFYIDMHGYHKKSKLYHVKRSDILKVAKSIFKNVTSVHPF